MALLLTLYLVATNNTQTVIGMLQNYRMAITRSIHMNCFMIPLTGRRTTDNILSAKLIMIVNIRMAFST